MGERNFGMHLKDHDNKRKTDVVFGDPTGVLDVPAVLKALKEVKFNGHISIEYEANPTDPSPDMKKCVAYVQGGGEESSAERGRESALYNSRVAATRTPAAQRRGGVRFRSPRVRAWSPMTPEEIAEAPRAAVQRHGRFPDTRPTPT